LETPDRASASKPAILQRSGPSAWGITLSRPKLASVRVAERAALCALATANRSSRLPGRAAVSVAVLARGFLSLLKLLCCRADYPTVQKSALIYGVLLALSASTLAGTGERATGAPDSSGIASDSPSSFASSGESAESRVAGLPPLSLNHVPEVSNRALSTAPAYTIRRTVPEVRLQFTVADEHGRLVQNLLPDDIRILDDQSPVARFDDFARDENLPLRLGIILDASDSVKRVLAEEKAAALDFLGRVLRPQSDRAFVMAFGADVQVWQDTTNDRAGLIQAVNSLHQPGWGTVLFDALYSACADLPDSEDGPLAHRAIIVLSDGDDTNSLHTLPDVIAAAQRSEIQIYALTVHKKGLRPQGDAILQRLADETGGGFFLARSAKDLQGVFAEIEQEMRTQYYVSFPPQQSAPGFHALQVEVVRAPQKLQVHARHGYYAVAQ
jgi:Ca-activated chloride channel homolog